MIVGLGNPGLIYEKTRHNAGFMVIDRLAQKHGASFEKHKFEAAYGFGEIAGKRVLFVKPQTYMNNSGRAVTALAAYYKIPAERLVVLFDDISLDVGKIRIRRKGSDGGHNGVKDILQLLGTQEVMRIKIGVGERPRRETDLKDWVLGKIPTEQEPVFSEALDNACAAAEEILTRGMDSAMN
ncbi:MAG: aminoacyl-tRNA hydrolase, partial [Clostridia bacterium]|nr:aminoacyl-tRNA hydrolase [Clostridia bacterium]